MRVACGALVVFVLGSLLHFVFGWLGGWRPVAVFAAVNESTWEHLKIAFWPGLVWAVWPSSSAQPNRSAYWSAQGYGLLVVSAAIVGLFHGYVAALGRNLLAVDITIFFVAVLLGQIVSAASIGNLARRAVPRLAGLFLLAIQVLAFVSFTFWPPNIWLFEDPRNGLFGVPAYSAPVSLRAR